MHLCYGTTNLSAVKVEVKELELLACITEELVIKCNEMGESKSNFFLKVQF